MRELQTVLGTYPTKTPASTLGQKTLVHPERKGCQREWSSARTHSAGRLRFTPTCTALTCTALCTAGPSRGACRGRGSWRPRQPSQSGGAQVFGACPRPPCPAR